MIKDENEARFNDPSQVVITKKAVRRYRSRRKKRTDARECEKNKEVSKSEH